MMLLLPGIRQSIASPANPWRVGVANCCNQYIGCKNLRSPYARPGNIPKSFNDGGSCAENNMFERIAVVRVVVAMAAPSSAQFG